MKIDEVVEFLDAKFHPEYQEDYDNAGFLVGCGGDECTGVLVALDLTEAVVAEAKSLGYNLIVTHHPFIFRGMKRITDRNDSGRLIIDMVRNGLATYAAHTNLDNLPDGVNGILAEKLGLMNCRILRASSEFGVQSAELSGCGNSNSELRVPWCAVGSADNSELIGAGMIGELPCEMDAEGFLQTVKKRLGLPWVRVSGERKTVRRVAICGGAGSFLIGDAMRAGADAFLTADLKYHDFQIDAPHPASEGGNGHMLLADIGHYESEQFAKEIIYRAISEKFSNFACRISECQQSVVHYI